MSDRLWGKIALITGGSTGIGLGTAKLFVAEGAYVFITGRRQAQLDAAVGEIGGNVEGIQGDVSNLGDLDRLFERIRAREGRLDIVFANAGGGEFAALGEITEEHFDRTFAINVKGVVFTVQKALALMPDGGAIVLNGSVSGSIGQPAFSVYAATKAALRSFARTWTVDLGARRIRVNVVSPGIIPTPAREKLGVTEEMYAEWVKGVPLGRVGSVEEVAKAVLFLASGDSSFSTGMELFVDGGAAQI